MKFFQSLTLVLACVLPGCSLVTLSTNIPFFYDYSVEIINQSESHLEVALSGQALCFKTEAGKVRRLPPTGTASIHLNNYSGSYSQATISVKGWTLPEGGELKGSAVQSVWIPGYYQQASTWIVTDETLKRGYGWGGLYGGW